MELNKLSFEPMPRTPSQVFDLTLLYVRPNFFQLLIRYLILMLPIALLGSMTIGLSYITLLIWWLKPLFERPLLHYLANHSFGIKVSLKDSIKALGTLKIIDIIKMLTIFRFSPNRAYLAPVEQLERQVGKAAAQRKNLLKDRCENSQTWWSLLCVHLELIFCLCLVSTIYALNPDVLPVDQQFTVDYFNGEVFKLIYFIGYTVSISIIAPYFVTGGFLMYLNSRIHLEGWDIELSFKRIATKVAQANRNSNKAIKAAAKTTKLCLVGLLAFSLNVVAPAPSSFAAAAEAISGTTSENISEMSPPNDPEKVTQDKSSDFINTLENQLESLQNTHNDDLNKVNKKPDYVRTEKLNQVHESVLGIYQDKALIRTESNWVPVKSDSQANLDWLKKLFEWFSWLGALGELSPVVGYLLWAVVIVLVLWITWRLFLMVSHNTKWSRKVHKRPHKKAQTQMPSFVSAEAKNEKWPNDLLNASKAALQINNHRYALALLLRHAITRISLQHPNLFHRSMTENECKLASMSVLPTPLKAAYENVFSYWINLAWAHKQIETQKIADLINQFEAIESSQATQGDS